MAVSVVSAVTWNWRPLLTRMGRLGWPVALSMLLLGAALASLAGTWWIQQQVRRVNVQVLAVQAKQAATYAQGTPSGEDVLPYPSESQYLEDLAGLFKAAKAVGISLGVVDYKTERSDKLPLVLYSLDIKIKEDYPKVKSFLSQVLADMGHVSLQELRVERPDASAGQGLMLLRLMMIYQASPAGIGTARLTLAPSGNTAAAANSPGGTP